MRFGRGTFGSERGATLIENLILTAAIAAIALPIVAKVAGDRTTKNLNANRGKLVGFIAQNRKQRVPNPWFSEDPIPTSNPGDKPRKTPSGNPPENENPDAPTGQNNADNPPPSPLTFARNNPAGSEDPLKSSNPFGGSAPDKSGSVPNAWTTEANVGQVNDSHSKSAFGDAGSAHSQRSRAGNSGDGGSNGESKTALKSNSDDSVSGSGARLANKKANDLAEVKARQRGLGNGSFGNGASGGGDDFDWWFLLRFLLILLIILILVWFLFAEMKRRNR